MSKRVQFAHSYPNLTVTPSVDTGRTLVFTKVDGLYARLANGSVVGPYIDATSVAAPSNMVTTDTAQTITGAKNLSALQTRFGSTGALLGISGTTLLLDNATTVDAATWTAMTTAPASAIQLNGGGVNILTAPSVGAGSALTFTLRAAFPLAGGMTTGGPVQVSSLRANATAVASRYVGQTLTGSPTNTSYATGDWAIARDTGRAWICTAGGNPGTWVEQTAALAANAVTTDTTQTITGTKTFSATITAAAITSNGQAVVVTNDARLSDARTPTAHTHPATAISDSTSTGRNVLTATDAVAARTAIGAGTSNFSGAYSALTGTPTTFATTAALINDATTTGRSLVQATDAAAARTAIGAGTSSFDGAYASLSGRPTLGTLAAITPTGTANGTTFLAGDNAWKTALTAPPSNMVTTDTTQTVSGGKDFTGALTKSGTAVVLTNDSRLSDARTPTAHTHTASQISDSTTVGRSVLTAIDAAAARIAIGAGTSSFSGAYSALSGIPSTFATTAALIGDSTTVGRSVLTATDATAARAAIGAGTSSFDGAYGSLSGKPTLGTAASANTGTGATNVILGNDARLADARTPTSHASTHATGGSDQLTPSDIGAVATSLLGVNSGVATLDATGKLTSAQIPAIAITDTFVVASQAAMLALTVEVGDVAVRSDVNQTYILRATPASTLANWELLRTPTDLVTSVNGRQGVVIGLAESNDTRFTDARTPTAHAASHSTGGTDPISPANIGAAPAAHTHTAANISDSTTVGRNVLTAVDGASARTAIGAGTSSFDGTYTALTGKPTTFPPTIGSTATTAVAGNDSRLNDARTPTAHTHTASAISDSTTVGRAVLTAVDAAAARSAIGAGTSSFSGAYSALTGIPSTFATTAALIGDASATGRSVLTAADAPAARTAIGAGTSSFSGAYSALTGIPSTFAPIIGSTATTAVAGNDSRLTDARTPTSHTHGVADLTATGTRDSTTFLRGDNTWAAPTVATPANVLTTDTVQTVTGAKTFGAGKLLTPEVRATAGQAVSLLDNAGLVRLAASAPGISLFGGTFGGGTGVMGVGNVTTAPTTNPAGGLAVYSEGGVLKYRGIAGIVTLGRYVSHSRQYGTTDTAQTLTVAGIKHLRSRRAADAQRCGTETAEPYSDVNAPGTLERTLVGRPPAQPACRRGRRVDD